MGRRVRSLVDGPRSPGENRIEWDGRDDEGRLLVSGVYFYRLRVGDRSETRRMVLLK